MIFIHQLTAWLVDYSDSHSSVGQSRIFQLLQEKISCAKMDFSGESSGYLPEKNPF